MSAATGAINYGITSDIVLTGTGIQTGAAGAPPPAITSLVVPFELQYHNTADPTGVQALDIAQIKSVGITSDYEAEGSITDTVIYVGISTYGNWSAPYAADTEFDVWFDIDRDGDPDFVLYNGVLAASTGSYVTILVNLHTGSTRSQDLINGVPDAFLDTAAHNNSVMVMPVYASDLGIVPGDSRFEYFVASGPRETSPFYSDFSPVMTYDPGNPGLDFNDGATGVPIWTDRPGDTIPVAYPNVVAYNANGSLGVLLLHLHNGFANREEIVDVNVPTLHLPLVVR